jgi:RNA polymerase sigma factor (sigma-70 family)
MGSRRSGELFRHLGTLFRVGAIGRLSDTQLLERFVAARDEAGEAAFHVLVERHGPMVLRVCWGVLHDPHEAEDAFQVTFLALARKAGSIQKQGSIASWLHGTARREALKAKTVARRRLARESRVAGPDVLRKSRTSLEDRENSLILHGEIERLPAKYRAPIVLCYLEGGTHEQAASELGWPVGTVRGRLARARDLLRSRLTRLGLALSAGLEASGSTADAAFAGLSAALVDATVHAALGSSMTLIQSLTQGVLSSMLLDKLKAISLAIIVVSAASGGVAAVWAPMAHETALTSAPQAQGQIGKARIAEISEIRFEGNGSIPAGCNRVIVGADHWQRRPFPAALGCGRARDQ